MPQLRYILEKGDDHGNEAKGTSPASGYRMGGTIEREESKAHQDH